MVLVNLLTKLANFALQKEETARKWQHQRLDITSESLRSQNCTVKREGPAIVIDYKGYPIYALFGKTIGTKPQER